MKEKRKSRFHNPFHKKYKSLFQPLVILHQHMLIGNDMRLKPLIDTNQSMADCHYGKEGVFSEFFRTPHQTMNIGV